MYYPILIETGDAETAYGVVVPDLPGCYSAGDTLEEAIAGAKEAVAAWIDAALDQGLAIPQPSSLDALRADSAYRGWAVAVIDLDAVLFDDTYDRFNITLPRRVARRLDDMAKAAGESRSSFIAKMTLQKGWERSAR